MSLSFAATGYAKPAQGSTLVIAGMLAAVIFLLALSAAFGVGSPSEAATIIGS
jgi:hypothetical protein